MAPGDRFDASGKIFKKKIRKKYVSCTLNHSVGFLYRPRKIFDNIVFEIVQPKYEDCRPTSRK